jgi:hypothetical protein
MSIAAPSPSVLSDELLSRFGGRAAEYDRENRFFPGGLRGSSSKRAVSKSRCPVSSAAWA